MLTSLTILNSKVYGKAEIRINDCDSLQLKFDGVQEALAKKEIELIPCAILLELWLEETSLKEMAMGSFYLYLLTKFLLILQQILQKED
jgi:hypothetical protein